MQNNEQQYYTGPGAGYAKDYNSNLNSTENAFIEDGFLKIQPIFDNTYPFADPYCSDKACQTTWDYTSARIITSSKKTIGPGNNKIVFLSLYHYLLLNFNYFKTCILGLSALN